MLLSDDEIEALAMDDDGSDDLAFARAIETAILAKLGAMELPEPVAWRMNWNGHSPSFTNNKSDYVQGCPHREDSYPKELDDLFTAEQLTAWGNTRYAQGAASQLSAEPEAWTWNTKSQHDGFLDAHFQFSKPIDDPRIFDLCPLYTRREAK
jgi:hypothetical protein